MDRPISNILTDAGREWTPKAAAEESEISKLRQLAPFVLPAEYVELLRFCNGGYGELDAPPLRFQMDTIAETVEHNEMWRKEGQYASFWFIGSNGGLETIGIDLRSGPPWPIVMIDCLAGEDSAEQIANDMAEFITKIGISADRKGT